GVAALALDSPRVLEGGIASSCVQAASRAAGRLRNQTLDLMTDTPVGLVISDMRDSPAGQAAMATSPPGPLRGLRRGELAASPHALSGHARARNVAPAWFTAPQDGGSRAGSGAALATTSSVCRAGRRPAGQLGGCAGHDPFLDQPGCGGPGLAAAPQERPAL